MSTIKRQPKSTIALLLSAAAVVAWACSGSGSGTRTDSATGSATVSTSFNVSLDSCLSDSGNDATTADFVVCAASDMARVTRFGSIELEHPNFDLSTGAVQLDAARNEVVAFQLIVRNVSTPTDVDASGVEVSQSGWMLNGQPLAATRTPITNFFAAHYHYVTNAGYTWGPRSDVLPWPDQYPDALVPNVGQCSVSRTPVFDTIALETENNANQSIWFDVFVPTQLGVGVYSQTITLTINSKPVEVPIEMTVHQATLPNKPTVNAAGEIYRAYRLEGADETILSPSWQRMSQCYQQLAHQHRTVFFERVITDPTAPDWEAYLETIEPMLTGELFTADAGYIGPGVNTPVGVWRTPWEQEINIERRNRVAAPLLTRLETDSAAWQNYVSSIGATDVDYFAYIYDEVDGPDPTADPDERYEYIRSVHQDMDDIQKAIDAGAPNDPRIDLIWTSHSNPTVWEDDPELDLTGKIRFWSPNASAADVPFLQERKAEGDKIWFYHSGHPAIGVHSINASGIEMRTWGVTAARYGFDGQLMWAVNLGSDEEPFAEPLYRPDEDRFGNGVMVYPGNQLPKIGYPATPGPLPSMRLKAWRRGLQDADLINLVRTQTSAATSRAMESRLAALVPRALTEGQRTAAWSSDPADWIDFRKSLLLDIR